MLPVVPKDELIVSKPPYTVYALDEAAGIVVACKRVIVIDALCLVV